MLSETILKFFNHFIHLSTKLYSIPSIWNPITRQFDTQTLKHMRIEAIIAVFWNLISYLVQIAYGYMIYTNLQDPLTVIQALIPITYLCALNWCAVIRYVSHVYRNEIEQFLSSFFKLNAYLDKLSRQFNFYHPFIKGFSSERA